MCDLLEVAGLARSSYYYALAHPKGVARAHLRPKVAQIFSRTPNGCGHRQVAMCLRAEEGARIADKTVLKMMREMGLRCGIRRERAYHRYNSYKGEVGQSFDNIIGRDFKADGPWQKMGTDVTEFKLSFGKAYLAPVYDFASKEIVAHSISMRPDRAQQQEMLHMLMDAKPQGAPRSRADLALGHGMAVPTRDLHQRARRERFHPEHVTQRQLHRQRCH